jgi:hypothetical protein
MNPPSNAASSLTRRHFLHAAALGAVATPSILRGNETKELSAQMDRAWEFSSPHLTR